MKIYKYADDGVWHGRCTSCLKTGQECSEQGDEIYKIEFNNVAMDIYLCFSCLKDIVSSGTKLIEKVS